MQNEERLRKIFDKTDGHCHLCHKKLSFSNYGTKGGNGAWNREHSVPRAKGGTDNLNNLYPACIPCNTKKGTLHTRTIRKRNGVTRAPYSKAKKERIRNDNTAFGAGFGAFVGIPFGPLGVIVGTLIGGAFGNSNSPRK